MSTDVRFVAVAGLESAPLNEGAVLFNPQSGTFLRLNGSAAFLWDELASPSTEEELAAKLCDRFAGLSLSTAREDAREMLRRMQDLDVVSSTHTPA